MATGACYSGGNPADDEGIRIAIWRWAKPNLIDAGMPFAKVKDEINNHFFQGTAKDAWLNDILSGRKTPFKEVSDEMFRAQYNRRNIVKQAEDLSRLGKMGPVQRAAYHALSVPRDIALLGHAFAYPVTHGIDLAFRPSTWVPYWKNFWGTYRMAFTGKAGEAFVARRIAESESDRWFTGSLRGGLDVGAKSHPVGLVSLGSKMNQRSWDMLKVMRFDLWKQAMMRAGAADMSKEDFADLSTHLADWANHASGSSKVAMPGGGNVWFGPKLTVSKFARMFADPAKTIMTFSKMATGQKTTVGERAVARLRLSGMAQYAGMLASALGIAWAYNKSQGVKDEDNINWNHPLAPGYLKFKLGGLEIGMPGMHTEIATLAYILAATQLPDTKQKELFGQTPQDAIKNKLWQYGWGKTAPGIQLGKELLLGHDWRGKGLPFPWVKPSKGQVSWMEYALSKSPIPAGEPAKYLYEKFQQNGMSALESQNLLRALTIFGIGYTGLHVKEAKPAKH